MQQIWTVHAAHIVLLPVSTQLGAHPGTTSDYSRNMPIGGKTACVSTSVQLNSTLKVKQRGGTSESQRLLFTTGARLAVRGAASGSTFLMATEKLMCQLAPLAFALTRRDQVKLSGASIDPARIVLLNVPLPESGNRFHDIVLNDGAPNGSRTRDGVEYPVFDALCLWHSSDYHTFQVNLTVPGQPAEDRLVELCRERKMGVEDWSTARMICAECSRGNPAPHDCREYSDVTSRPNALAARSEDDVRMLLAVWVAEDERREYGAIDLCVPGVKESSTDH